MVWAILLLISVLPAVFHFLGYMFLRFYTLDDKKMEEIKTTLEQRHGKEQQMVRTATVEN